MTINYDYISELNADLQFITADDWSDIEEEDLFDDSADALFIKEIASEMGISEEEAKDYIADMASMSSEIPSDSDIEQMYLLSLCDEMPF